ncbi:hypothetical protein HDV57DRAFT_329786 [Trichoderma longibrachiatum]|uniref:Uncharacterized protein n=1 Tax=Trichoderma longibrachiatum ATCC 18648 TaxID=983965 RepID=A0A2T4BVM6_TRILO|nr:hypothetical protein M440DRAFT_1061177 [Trichoderma longibrachiatum ATCC 18648]
MWRAPQGGGRGQRCCFSGPAGFLGLVAPGLQSVCYLLPAGVFVCVCFLSDDFLGNVGDGVESSVLVFWGLRITASSVPYE